MSDAKKYIKFYEEYRAIYKRDKDEASRRNSSFEMPLPQKWTKESVRLKAFLERERELYVESLSDFEFRLKKLFSSDEQALYEELITLYREEYFRYQSREYENLFFLDDTTKLKELAKKFALYSDKESVSNYLYSWQRKIDSLKEEESTLSIVEIRTKERKLLQEYTKEFSELLSLVKTYVKELSILLSEYETPQLLFHDFNLQHYFQNNYDFSQESELREFLSLHTTLDINKNIAQIRNAIQNKIYENNRDSERELAKSDARFVGDILLKYASQESQLVTHYKKLLSIYYSYLDIEEDFMLVNEPFELYFDNYFADFVAVVKYYKRLYAGETKRLTQTPYYMKIYNATQAKMVIINTNIARELQSTKEAYASHRSYLSELKNLEREYAQEIEILLDEFANYGEIYIKEVGESESDLALHEQNIEKLRERFDLRNEHGFF